MEQNEIDSRCLNIISIDVPPSLLQHHFDLEDSSSTDDWIH